MKSVCVKLGISLLTYIIVISLVINFKIFRSNFVMFTFSFNIFLFILYICFNFSDAPFSLNNIFLLFFLFFLGVAPVLQYQNKIVMWDDTVFSDLSYISMNITILFIFILYNILYRREKFRLSKENKPIDKKKQHKIIKRDIKKYSNYKLMFISFFSSILIFYVNDFSIMNMIFRSGENIINNGTIDLIYSAFIMPIPAISLVLYKLNNKKNYVVELSLLILLLISNFPTSQARFYIAIIYLPVIILYFKPFQKSKYLFTAAFIIGLLILFPFLNQFRGVDDLSNITFKPNFQMFLEGHFDTYEMFMRVLISKHITYGKQLIGAIFFFIPRSIWPNKPQGSGSYIASIQNLSFSNISMNFFGEGYINFGFIGIILFVYVLARITSSIDFKYWIGNNKTSIIFRSFYMFSIGMLFFILRGDLLSSYSYSFGITISLITVSKMSSVKGINYDSEKFN